MKRWLVAVLTLCVSIGSAGCRVDETHSRCGSSDDCASGQDCYLGYCVLTSRDASVTSSSDSVLRDDAGAGLRRRPTPTLTGRALADAGLRVGNEGAACVSSDDEDAGAVEGACCERPVACYSGPEGTLGVGRCEAGMRACEEGRLGGCEGSVQPRTETCKNQGTDDDCDGELDNVRGRGESCMVETDIEACRAGVMACVEGEDALRCVPEAPPPEQCNAEDDDCDHKVDEDFDLMKDAMNCGECGTRCSQMQACCMGACVARGPGPDGCPECGPDMPCADGGTCCGGGCVDTRSDERNCGGCGMACGDRQTCCDGMCVDTRSDEMNCGGCGMACTEGGSPRCCGGSCVDVSRDRRHCGQCGYGCGAVCACELDNGQAVCRGPLGFCF